MLQFSSKAVGDRISSPSRDASLFSIKVFNLLGEAKHIRKDNLFYPKSGDLNVNV